MSKPSLSSTLFSARVYRGVRFFSSFLLYYRGAFCKQNIYAKSQSVIGLIFCMSRNIVIGGNQVSKKDERRKALLRFIRRRSGRRFTVAVIAREFGVSERTIQSDLSVLEVFGQIRRTPSYNSLHRQNGNIIVYTGSRKRQSHKSDDE